MSSAGNPVRKRPPCMNNFKILTRMRGYALGLSDLGEGPGELHWEHRNEPPGSVNYRVFCEHLSYYQLLKTFAPWRFFYWHEDESNENLKKCPQNWYPTVCSCRHSKSSACARKCAVCGRCKIMLNNDRRVPKQSSPRMNPFITNWCT